MARRVRRLVFVVARDQEELFASLSRTFAGDETVRVVKDRRLGERRKGAKPGGAERRRTDRRTDSQDLEQKLRARGYAIVSVLAVKE